MIRSGADGAVVLQTAGRVRGAALHRPSRDPGLRRRARGPLRPADPVGARPRRPRRSTATVTLSYLASGFDWQANYVATLSPDGDRVDLFAWLTLANGDETSFRNADTQAVAGRLNRERVETDERRGEAGCELRCWPQAGRPIYHSRMPA